jgi:sulfate permease, SulP family
MDKTRASQLHQPPSWIELFSPKLLTVLREAYGWRDLRADALAGLTVAIIALPLSMAIAIASGASPERGLFTAVIGGFLISCLGGSRFQIGGPAAAFTIVVAMTISRHGLDGLFIATLVAGTLLTLMGILRLGSYVKFIPYPVTVGFVAGIAIVLLISQIHDLLGLTVNEPPALLERIGALAGSIGSINPAACVVSLGTVAVIVGLRWIRPGWPGILIAVALAALCTYLLQLPIETIGTRFGGIPSTLPAPGLPALTLDKLVAVFPDAVTFTLLGAVESLLSATVADGMTGRRHRSNMELVAQGIANIASSLFGGLPATGTIARTATNVRAGARGPLSGMFHALFILLFMLVAAPLATYVPLSSLAGILVVVAWNMADKHEVFALIKGQWGDRLVVLSTILLTLFVGLTEAIVVGFALSSLFFIHRMSQVAGVEAYVPHIEDDMADGAGQRDSYRPELATSHDFVVFRITGAFFFGAAGTVSSVLDRIADQHKALILDFSSVSVIDSTAANSMVAVVRKARRHGGQVIFAGASTAIRRALESQELREPDVRFAGGIEAAIAEVRDKIVRG